MSFKGEIKKISVILTTYNSENTIGKTIESILGQDGIGKDFDLELIAIDDCSSDNTLGILNNYDLLIFSTGQNSGGPNKGRNIGLTNASGDYICIADHDDVWEKHKITSLLPFLDKVPVVTSGYTVIDRSKNKHIVRVNQSGRKYVYFEQNQTFLSKLKKSLKGQNTYLGSIVFRKELKYLLFEEHFGAVDFDWVLRLFHNRDSIEVCDSLYCRFVSDNNLSLDESYRIKDFYYSLMQIETYEKLYPNEVRTAYLKIYGSRARYYYLIGNMKKTRLFLLKSNWNLKTLFYYLTTFFGSAYVKRRFNVFG